jgi:hypothetical protein
MDLDLAWDWPLQHRKGAEERLCGIDVFHEFDWLDVFSDERTQFKNGKCLARFVQEHCPAGKTPALLLTLRKDIKQGLRQSEKFAVFVVNITEYRATDGDAALSYLATHLEVDITDIEQLEELAEATDPELLRNFIESSLDIEHIVEWARDNEQRLEQLRTVVGTPASESPTLAETLEALGSVEHLPVADIRAIVEFLGTGKDMERRLEIARTVASDASGLYVIGEVLAERTQQRVQDARETIAAYQALLDDPSATETAMQQFIEKHLWLLGLDYAAMRPRKSGPSGAMDFLLERFDGFHDLLELKSPHDPIIKAPNVDEGDPVPAPHEYALSSTVAQALAQAMVYRDRLTRFAGSASELYGLPHSRDPRLVVVVGTASALPKHRRDVLLEFNKSMHRIEIVPYDVLANRAIAVLNNVQVHLVAAAEERDEEESANPLEEVA